MFGISGAELLIILIFAFIIFGPDKLPVIAKTVGKAISKFREVQSEAKETINVDSILNSENDNAVDETIDNIMKLKDKALSSAKELSVEGKEAVDMARESLAEKKAMYDEAREKRNANSADSGSKTDDVEGEVDSTPANSELISDEKVQE